MSRSLLGDFYRLSGMTDVFSGFGVERRGAALRRDQLRKEPRGLVSHSGIVLTDRGRFWP